MELTIITKKTRTIYVYPKLIRVETLFGMYDIYFFDEEGNIQLHSVKQDNVDMIQIKADTSVKMRELYNIDGDEIE